jgi:hypothetical protein
MPVSCAISRNPSRDIRLAPVDSLVDSLPAKLFFARKENHQNSTGEIGKSQEF